MQLGPLDLRRHDVLTDFDERVVDEVLHLKDEHGQPIDYYFVITLENDFVRCRSCHKLAVFREVEGVLGPAGQP